MTKKTTRHSVDRIKKTCLMAMIFGMAASAVAADRLVKLTDPKDLALTARYDAAKVPADSKVTFIGYVAEQGTAPGSGGKTVHFTVINNIPAAMGRMMGSAFAKDNAFFAGCYGDTKLAAPPAETKVRVTATFIKKIDLQTSALKDCSIEITK